MNVTIMEFLSIQNMFYFANIYFQFAVLRVPLVLEMSSVYLACVWLDSDGIGLGWSRLDSSEIEWCGLFNFRFF
jgi:hypothetical protein